MKSERIIKTYTRNPKRDRQYDAVPHSLSAAASRMIVAYLVEKSPVEIPSVACSRNYHAA